ncbi:zinc ribbon domain-containing protein [Helicobacter felis]|uniref:Transposase, IS605 OrfB family n=1 Tax=Helicobacter felis (strain ATCC 49179 / CCUG 28539 / NCTC 12436 / CS1) TaxID=936155 RepID=E7AC39_HELFC|nr:zinc ribbon domain-containing protein [Helicobacter felis]CBY82121.1 transposase, IS605 OrfB family [Helicobacter felis ATCC 49179]
MLVTRVLYAKYLNLGKLEQLKLQAKRLGVLRSAIWQEYGALKGLGKTDREIRNLWVSQRRDFKVSANAWKETLRDCFSDIKLYKEAAKSSVHKAIFNHYPTDKERKEAFIKLKKDTWIEDSFLHRLMRKAFKHGKNKVYNQIIVRSDDYSVFGLNSQAWLSIPSLIKNKRVKIPLNTTMDYAPTGTLRLIIRNGVLENLILKNNLGRKKLNRRDSQQKSMVKTKIYTACHQVVNKAKIIVCEDLTYKFSKKSQSKTINRRLNTWVKGIIASALKCVSECRGSTLHLVNPAYTSQSDSFSGGLLLGQRKGDYFYRENGEVVQADYNAARNILARYFDTEISRFMSYEKVKAILLRRTDSYRLATASSKTLVAKESK